MSSPEGFARQSLETEPASLDGTSEVHKEAQLESNSAIKAQRAILSAESHWFGAPVHRAPEWNGGYGRTDLDPGEPL